MKGKWETTDCPVCHQPCYVKSKEKCYYCGYDKSFEDAEKAIAELKDAISAELIKVVKWLKNIFMEEVK